MGGIENPLNFLKANAGIFEILMDSVGVALEGFDGVFSAGKTKSKIVLEEIIMPEAMSGTGWQVSSRTGGFSPSIPFPSPGGAR